MDDPARNDELKGVQISEVMFKDAITKRRYCSIFRVDIRGREYVIKVGITPKFYGVIENIDINQCRPHLDHFPDRFPMAIILEYIPNLVEINWENYNEKRAAKFVDYIDQIHKALVKHGDMHPRNLMTVAGDEERAIYIDFDRAKTFDDEPEPREQGFLEFESLVAADILDLMVRELVPPLSSGGWLLTLNVEERF
ncbi:hypothetical protein FQN57_005771 [Myotisia sp. PD_48]|nr:hypothetical protein FQN57_005771 [Myotisia sp. PD_48]